MVKSEDEILKCVLCLLAVRCGHNRLCGLDDAVAFPLKHEFTYSRPFFMLAL